MNTRDDSRLYDVRTLERNLRKGLITRKDYDKFLKALPDREANATVCKPDETPVERYVAPPRVRTAPTPFEESDDDLDEPAFAAALDDEDDEDDDEDEDDEEGDDETDE